MRNPFRSYKSSLAINHLRHAQKISHFFKLSGSNITESVTIFLCKSFYQFCFPNTMATPNTQRYPLASFLKGLDFDKIEVGVQPVVGYLTPNGGTHQLRPKLLLPWNGFTIGDKVTVLYDPLTPTDARLDLFEQLWLIPAFSAALGALLVGGPALAWALGLFRPRPAKAIA